MTFWLAPKERETIQNIRPDRPPYTSHTGIDMFGQPAGIVAGELLLQLGRHLVVRRQGGR